MVARNTITWFAQINLLILYAYRDVSNEVKNALRAMEKAEELGLEADSALPVRPPPNDRSTSLTEALNTLGGWQARSPSEFAAEFFQMGEQNSYYWSFHIRNAEYA